LKRGLITWDKTEIPPEVFENRVNRVRRVLAERDLPAMAVYSDLWRSSQARFFSNYMPYFNRALLILPQDGKATLLCGLSPRVYGWIRSVTTIEDVRPAGNFAKPLFEIAGERNWTRIGVLDLEQLPYDMYNSLRGGSLALVDIESTAVFSPADDESERAIRRKAAALAAEILQDEMQNAVGFQDHGLREYLAGKGGCAGAEDLVVLVTNGRTVPAPASGSTLEQSFSVSLALEYRGHWVRISRTHGPAVPARPSLVERLDGSYAYECGTGSVNAGHCEYEHGGNRLFYGDTVL